MATTETTPTRPALDEAALRRPGFQDGAPVALCDGQTWHLPRPAVDHYAFDAGPDGKTRLAVVTTLGPGYDALLRSYAAADTGTAEAVALYDVAAALLARNYDLPPGACSDLLYRVRTGDPREADNLAMWARIADAALGRETETTPATT